jgi:hypothetical protein
MNFEIGNLQNALRDFLNMSIGINLAIENVIHATSLLTVNMAGATLISP